MNIPRLSVSLALTLLGLIGTLAVWGTWAGGPAAAQAQGSATRYVATTGADAGDCADPAHPCATVQYAVDQAAERDEVRIATGVYTDVQQRAGITQTVYISKTVTLRGGYDAVFTEPPDPAANPTTLDAQGQGRVLCVVGDISPTIEGLRITGGDASRLRGYVDPWGGACDAGGGGYILTATAILRDNRVFDNSAQVGGGLYLRASTATLSRNIVTANIAELAGGGVYLDTSDATLSANAVTINTAPNWGGGGLYLQSSSATFNGNIVTTNTAQYSDGGGLCLWYSDAALSSNTIAANTAFDGGGGLSLYHSDGMFYCNTIVSNTAGGGGGLSLSYSDAVFNGNTITDNSANVGGGLSLTQSDAMLISNIIADNVAEYVGGGLNLVCCTATLTNNLIAGNQANAEGSGLHVWGSLARLWHTTIAGNRGSNDSGVCVAEWTDWTGTYPGTAFLTNTILVSHTIGITVSTGSTVTLEATLWGTGTWANDTDWAGAGTIITGTRNVWGDPAFVNPAAGDYHIGPTSAALDAGVDAGVHTDIDGEPRPYQLPDLGADEYWPPGALKRFYLPLAFRGA